MEAAEYLQMAELQDRHWWFEVKRRTVAALLAHHAAGLGRPGDRVLEVGAGTGAMSTVMRRHGSPFATDAYLPALQMLRRRGAAATAGEGPASGRGQEPAAARRRGSQAPPAAPGDPVAIAADLGSLPFAAGSFALVGCFDVLYHRGVRDLDGALRELQRVCRPGGYVAITDSAFPMLRSSHDLATHAARRFRLPELIPRVEAAGLRVVHVSYFHTLLFPAAAAVRLGKRLLHGAPRLGDEAPARSDLAEVPALLNAALRGLYRLETPLVVRLRMPFGVSLLMLARRTG